MKVKAAAIALLLATASLAAEPPPPRERWSLLPLGNISIYGNAGDRALRGTAENFVRFRETLVHVQGLTVQSPLPTYVYVFQNESSFAPYRTAAVGPKNRDVIGIFSQHDAANWVLIQARSDYAFDRVIYHELTHYFLRNSLPGLPPWLDEGLAGFYETFSPIGRSDLVTIGKPPYKYLDVLREMGLIPLRQLFAAHPLRDHSSSDPRVQQFYLQSWLLMHYLLIGNPERGAALGPFVAALGEGQPVETAFANAFHAKMEEVDGELGAYLRRGRFNMIQYSVTASGAKIADPVPIPRDETLFVLGNLLAHIDPSAGGEQFLTESLKANPNHAAAAAELARLLDIDGMTDEANKLYERALAMAGSDPRPYVRASLRMVSSMQIKARDGELIDRGSIETARGYAEKALKLAPDDVLANAILGASYTFAGQDAAKGIAFSSRALEMAPAMTDVAADLVLLYSRAGRPAMATAMIDRVLIPSGENERIAEANENLALADYIRGTELLQRHSDAEARALLDRAANATHNENLKAKIASLRAATNP